MGAFFVIVCKYVEAPEEGGLGDGHGGEEGEKSELHLSFVFFFVLEM